MMWRITILITFDDNENKDSVDNDMMTVFLDDVVADSDNEDDNDDDDEDDDEYDDDDEDEDGDGDDDDDDDDDDDYDDDDDHDVTVLLILLCLTTLFQHTWPRKGTYVAASQQDDYHPARSHRDPTSFNHSTRHANHVVKQPLLDSLWTKKHTGFHHISLNLHSLLFCCCLFTYTAQNM